MKSTWPMAIAAILSVFITAAGADDAGYAVGGSASCIECHDFGPQSPVHALMEGSHGLHEDAEAMRERHGCEDCHGPSAGHAASPTEVAPRVSFGPRWSATGADQDSACLKCHEADTAAHWRNAMHMLNGITCISCHDIHTGGDKVLFPWRQAEVCTVCHKAQKHGIHGLGGQLDAQPACSHCHNPHDHESAETQMLLTRSDGCRSCHDLVAIEADPATSETAVKRHKVMASAERTCVECHSGIAHAPHDSVTAFTHRASNRASITLFYPGQSDNEWLTRNHPGSQPLRQGANCQLCHRGEEANMGRVLADPGFAASRTLDLSFELGSETLAITLAWEGTPDDRGIALMWGTDANDSFRRGGCFAACHNNMQSMLQDRGPATGKYLWSPHSQQQRPGQPAITGRHADLAELLRSGAYAALWQIDLPSGKAHAATVLDRVTWSQDSPLTAEAGFQDGWWRVTITQPITNYSPALLSLDPLQRYIFGVAMHGAKNPGAAHWVSLPFTLGTDGADTDFVLP